MFTITCNEDARALENIYGDRELTWGECHPDYKWSSSIRYGAILRGVTPRGRAFLREGRRRKIARISEGIPQPLAEALSRRGGWGIEKGVVELARELYELASKVGCFVLRGTYSHAEFENLTGIDSPLSLPRKSVAQQIAAEAILGRR